MLGELLTGGAPNSGAVVYVRTTIHFVTLRLAVLSKHTARNYDYYS